MQPIEYPNPGLAAYTPVLLKIGASYLADLVHANHPLKPFPA